MIHVERSIGKGRGVYAGREFRPGDLIESAPVVVIPAAQRASIAATILDYFVFEWGAEGLEVAVVLGFGSLYNHSSSPNAHYHKDVANSLVEFVCVAPIAEGEEILINYNGNRCDSIPIVFEGDTWRSVAD